MKNTAEERFYEQLVQLEAIHSAGVTATQIAESLEIKRNSASHYLNILLASGKVTRSDTKPAKWQTRKQHSDDIFSSFIGYEGSLKLAIEQCKAAVEYPTQGLSIILNGSSGVGKSYLASIIYEYSKREHLIAEDAPLVTLNCADYANNPELLSATLFGYKKGAFTGANEDRSGLIAEADGGYLFLDEVHRLSFENQEKLFLLMDQGIYRPVGEKREIEVCFRYNRK